MDSVTRFLALLTVTGAGVAGAASATQAAPVSDELKIVCERGVEEACKTIDVEAQLNTIWGFDVPALALFGSGSSSSSSSGNRPDPIY